MRKVHTSPGPNSNVAVVSGARTLHVCSVEVPPEWHCPRAVSRVLGEGAVELLAGEGVDSGPAVLAVVLEAAD